MSKRRAIRCENVFFFADDVASVNKMKNAIGVINHRGEIIYWHPETNKEMLEKVANALTDAVLDGKEIDWVALRSK